MSKLRKYLSWEYLVPMVMVGYILHGVFFAKTPDAAYYDSQPIERAMMVEPEVDRCNSCDCLRTALAYIRYGVGFSGDSSGYGYGYYPMTGFLGYGYGYTPIFGYAGYGYGYGRYPITGFLGYGYGYYPVTGFTGYGYSPIPGYVGYGYYPPPGYAGYEAHAYGYGYFSQLPTYTGYGYLTSPFSGHPGYLGYGYYPQLGSAGYGYDPYSRVGFANSAYLGGYGGLFDGYGYLSRAQARRRLAHLFSRLQIINEQNCKLKRDIKDLMRDLRAATKDIAEPKGNARGRNRDRGNH